MSADPLAVLTIVTGLLVAGEALALWIGLIVFHPESPWITKPVQILLVIDIVSGAALVASTDSSILQVPAATVILATHAYRVWENITRKPGRFCFNKELVALNIIKLLGAVGVIVLLILSL
jgi:hypothetical protein